MTYIQPKMSTVGELLQLIEHDIPDSRRQLNDSYNNLEKVAAYCEGNYLQAGDKRHALEETKSYTTQSLASVAYQINTLATNFLHLLDLQTQQMKEMESSISHLSQTVMIHKEKVARREIGVLTTNKTTTRPAGVKNPGIIFPEQPERPIKYVRKPIDYSVLDEVGHGVKVQQANPAQNRQRRASSGSSKSVASSSAGNAPTTKPPTPPSMLRGGTLTRQTSSPYRTPAPPVSPPSVPSHYAPSYVQQRSMEEARRSQYAALANIQVAQVPPQLPGGTVLGTGLAPLAMPQSVSGVNPNPSPSPPVPTPAEHRPEEQHVMFRTSRLSSSDPPPPPVSEAMYSRVNRMGNVSPPLPPPPEATHTQQVVPPQRASIMSQPHQQFGQHHQHFTPPPAHFNEVPGYAASRFQMEQFHGRHGQEFADREAENTDWMPKSYIEKVVAIYDYLKDKEDELTFSEGSLIYVIKKNDDGWWEGVMDGVTGLFPGNYVEPCI